MSITTSVVLCTYNGMRHLSAQWASVLAQSRLPDEIVVRDDASTDDTPALLARLAAEAKARGIAVRCIRGECNLGYVANFEAALMAASGDVLLLCDQDDVWHVDKLATLLAEFEQRPNLLLLCSDARRIDADGNVLHRSLFDVLKVSRAELRGMHAGQGFQVLLRRSLATGATVALRRTLLADALPFPEGWVHDEWLAVVAAALGGFDCVERMLVDYRQHEGNQIGMPDRGLQKKWQDLRNPRADLIDMLIARGEHLVQRLRQTSGKIPSAYIESADEKLAHLRVRQSIGGAPWMRMGFVLRETLGGGYRRYGSGWRSALRDLVRRR